MATGPSLERCPLTFIRKESPSRTDSAFDTSASTTSLSRKVHLLSLYPSAVHEATPSFADSASDDMFVLRATEKLSLPTLRNSAGNSTPAPEDNVSLRGGGDTPEPASPQSPADESNTAGDNGTAAPASEATKRKQKVILPANGPRNKKLTLKLKMGQEPAASPTPGPTHAPTPSTDSFTTEQPTTSKRGRRAAAQKKKFDQDTVVGAAYDELMNAGTKRGAQKANKTGRKKKEDEEYRPKKRGSTPKQSALNLLSDPAPEPLDLVESSPDTVDADPFDRYRDLEPGQTGERREFTAYIDPSIYKIYDVLESATEIPIDLPDIEEPWTAKHLTHLYIVCYNKRAYDLCDLVADTWIRAFQKLNHNRNPANRIWKPNSFFHQQPGPVLEQWYLNTRDPPMHDNVTDFDTTLLNELYHHTPPGNGARMLWADAMALCGAKIEDIMQKSSKRGTVWHRDIHFNVMCTALRMARRRLTLKIEEYAETSWCKRYHTHYAHGLECYRQIEKKERLAAKRAEEANHETNRDLNGKRIREMSESDEDEDMPPSKRVSFSIPDAAFSNDSPMNGYEASAGHAHTNNAFASGALAGDTLASNAFAVAANGQNGLAYNGSFNNGLANGSLNNGLGMSSTVADSFIAPDHFMEEAPGSDGLDALFNE